MSDSGNMRTFVIVNPGSAGGATRRRWERIARNLTRTIGSFESAFTDAPRHATSLTRAALGAGFELIVAVGGDGTANEVACGFFDGPRPLAPQAALGIVPHGSGVDLPRTLSCGKTLDEACARMAGRRTQAIDVGHVRFVDHEGRSAERVFLNAMSFGCGGAVVHALSSGTKRFGGRIAFALTTAKVLFAYRDQPVVVAVDGGPPEQLTVTSYAVCNGKYFGGGMQVAPAAEVDDGLLDVTIWSGFRLKDFVIKRAGLYDGTHVGYAGTKVLRVRSVEATSEERVLVDVDGEAAGLLPIRVDIFPRALLFKR